MNPDALGWNAKFAFLWAPGCVLGAIWVYFYLPEVKDRKLEEIDEMVRENKITRPFHSDGYLDIIATRLGLSADTRIVLSTPTCEEVQAVRVHRHRSVDG